MKIFSCFFSLSKQKNCLRVNSTMVESDIQESDGASIKLADSEVEDDSMEIEDAPPSREEETNSSTNDKAPSRLINSYAEGSMRQLAQWLLEPVRNPVSSAVFGMKGFMNLPDLDSKIINVPSTSDDVDVMHMSDADILDNLFDPDPPPDA